MRLKNIPIAVDIIDETLMLVKVIDDYNLEINEELILLALKERADLIKTLDDVTWKEYKEIIALVIEQVEKELKK